MVVVHVRDKIYKRDICRGVYNGEPKASHCKAHTDLSALIFHRTCDMKAISSDVHKKLMNTNRTIPR